MHFHAVFGRLWLLPGQCGACVTSCACLFSQIADADALPLFLASSANAESAGASRIALGPVKSARQFPDMHACDFMSMHVICSNKILKQFHCREWGTSWKGAPSFCKSKSRPPDNSCHATPLNRSGMPFLTRLFTLAACLMAYCFQSDVPVPAQCTCLQ